jgi:hypothetical protein
VDRVADELRTKRWVARARDRGFLPRRLLVRRGRSGERLARHPRDEYGGSFKTKREALERKGWIAGDSQPGVCLTCGFRPQTGR